MRTLFAAPRRALLLLVVVALLLLVASSAYAKIRTPEGGDLPYYARIQSGEVFHDGEWAAIVFYRPPDCVPDNFDLLAFYDFGAVDCGPPTTDGFIIWYGAPGDTPPIQINLRGLGAVPVWFVAWPELEAALLDDSLTMSELEAMERLTGSASFYTETLHPTGVVKVPMINYVAHGMLEDGQSFKVHVTLVTGSHTDVRITFR
jgi:hypothetical protein